MKYQINLFPPKELNFVDKAVYFSFNYLRYILVITQLVVISVFFYRFKIDQEIVDLKDSLQQKEEIVNVSNSLLRDVKAIDIKSRNITTVITQQDNFKAMTDYFLSGFPSAFFLTKLEIFNNGIRFDGTTTNIAVVRAYYLHLKAEKKFKTITLDNLRKSETSGYQFSFNLSNFQKK